MQLRFSGAKLGGEQRTSGLTNAPHRGGIEARTEEFHLAEFFALPPRVRSMEGLGVNVENTDG